MTTLVLTVIGDDRSGLVADLSEIIAEHGGNWATSEMAQLGGKFAGIVLVDVADDQVDDLTAALESNQLAITVQRGTSSPIPSTNRLTIDFIGTDRPGIVRQITDVISSTGASIETLSSDVVEAPMAGGNLFTATATVLLDDAEAESLQSKLEDLADELMVEFTFGR
ncbi:ACT domain-containing protein [Microbacterium sp. NC79]|uniref:glycine cleavage system protein R n=1 Tax=Microbacterium sp. NC79 TaxID=2851009 RepID=UPI001C2CA40D|nr:amino acid-binding ACT protein [Microbacterium sp. NC79]